MEQLRAYSRREAREVNRATSWKPTSKGGHTSVAIYGGVACSGHGCCQTRKMAICWHSRFLVQQLCQHLASSPVPSYRSNAMSLRCFTFPKSSLPPEGGKTLSLIENASLFLNITTVFLECPTLKI